MPKRSKKWRKRAGRVLKRTVAFTALFGALLGLGIAVASGSFGLAILLIPAIAAGTVFALPFILLAFLVALLAVALPFGILAAIFGGPFWVIHRLTRGPRTLELHDEEDDEEEQLTFEQRQQELLATLKERYTHGQLTLSEYERELERLISPNRQLDYGYTRPRA